MLPDQQPIPAAPKLYYITHIENLASIFTSGYLFSDAHRIQLGLASVNIGMSRIKERRLHRHQVTCHPGTMVGQYVPFYFCPRSIMLYIISRQDNPDLTYQDGQNSIVHLQIDLHRAVTWANNEERNWAFSDRNAATVVANFYSNLEQLNLLNWTAINSHDFTQSEIKEGKQAEFLIHHQVAWELVERIGVINDQYRRRVAEILREAQHLPEITIERTWYY